MKKRNKELANTKKVLRSLMNARLIGGEKTHCLYVIGLSGDAAACKKFREANPNMKDGRECFYVGMTCRTPEERFEQHKRGYRSSKWVRLHGRRLVPHLFLEVNPMPRKCAERYEKILAEALREDGYGVIQN